MCENPDRANVTSTQIQPPQGLDRGMQTVTTGMELVAHVLHAPEAAQPLECILLGNPRMGRPETLRPTQPDTRRQKAPPCQINRLDPRLRRDPGVIGLAHGAELALEARGPRGRKPKRPHQRLPSEPGNPARRQGRPERARRRGLVKSDLIMVPTEPKTDPNRCLSPDQGCVDQCLGAQIPSLGHRQRRRDNRHRGMPNMGKMRIVIVERMADRSVDQSCRPHRNPAAADKAGLPRPAFLERLRPQNRRQRLGPARNPAGRPVKERQPHHLARALARHRFQRKSGKCLFDAHRAPISFGQKYSRRRRKQRQP